MKVLLPGKHVAKLPTHLELDLLNLSGLSVGWVLSADGDSSASWKQLSHTLLDDIGNNNHNAIDSHLADGSKHFLEGAIDHTAILNIGNNTHAAIDTFMTPTTVEDILFADTVSSFSKGQILADISGNVIIDNNGNLVWGS